MADFASATPEAGFAKSGPAMVPVAAARLAKGVWSDTLRTAVVPNGKTPLTKRLTPMPDGSLLESDELWPAGVKTIEQRTLELLDNGYVLCDTRIDGSRLFERR